MHPIVERVKALVASARHGHRYKVESSILEFTEQIVARMEQKEISPKSLAERMGVKPSYVSKILRGTSNFTLDSMIKICSAVDAEYCFHVRPIEVTAVWETYETVSPVVSVEFHTSTTADSARSPAPPPPPGVKQVQGAREAGLAQGGGKASLGGQASRRSGFHNLTII